MDDALVFTLNGQRVEVRGASPCLTLLDWLRQSGRAGTKEGCAEGDCGACSVALAEVDASGRSRWRAINSCLTLLPMVAGRALVTVEGLSAEGAPLHPVQQAMVDAYGSQCGYCTPGFVMSLFEGYHRDDLRGPGGGLDPVALDEQLCGNLCRCTGYRPIREAAERALGAPPPRADGLSPEGRPGAGAGEPLADLAYEGAGARFFRPRSLAALLERLAAEPGARLVGGATDLGLEVTKRYRRLPTLISTEAVAELGELAATPAAWRVGAAVTLTRLHEAAGAEWPALDAMLRVFGSRQIRNRATVGGNLATASPIGDLAPVLLALGAEVVLASSEGERTLALDDFFVAYRVTALRPGEVIRAVTIPRGASAPSLRRVSASYKVSKRREMDISIVSAAFALDLDAGGVIRAARLAYGGVAAIPARARAAERALLGRRWDEDAARAAAPHLDAAFTPISDHRGSAGYRRRLVSSLFARFAYEQASAALASR